MAAFDVPVTFKRIYKGPLDKDTVFYTEQEMEDYLTNPVRYAGQMATLATSTGVSVFILNKEEDQWMMLDFSSAVFSVNGKTGHVTLTTGDIEESDNKYFITQEQLDSISNVDGGTF